MLLNKGAATTELHHGDRQLGGHGRHPDALQGLQRLLLVIHGLAAVCRQGHGHHRAPDGTDASMPTTVTPPATSLTSDTIVLSAR